MNILLASGDAYSQLGLITIASILQHNNHVEDLVFYYFDNDISETNKENITELVHSHKREIIFMAMPSFEKMDIHLDSNLKTNEVLYTRCFLHLLLPQHVEKIIVFDCDAVALDSLEPLWNTDMDDYYIAATDDIKSAYFKKTLGLQKDDIYFNAGVFMVNLKKWREDDVTAKMEAAIEKQRGRLLFELQDEMNLVLGKKALILHPKYNCTTALFCFSYKNMCRYRHPNTVFSEKVWQEAVTKPVIIHYTTNQIIQARPWIQNCMHPIQKPYLDIQKTTVMADMPLWKDNRGHINSFARFCYKYLPQAMTAHLFGIAQAYLQPMLVRLKNKTK